MFVPLHDTNALTHNKLQYVTLGLIIINVVVFAFTAILPDRAIAMAGYGLGYIPAVSNEFLPLDASLYLVPSELTSVTYAFLHADWLHLGGNMLFLWVFGDNVEDAMGHLKFLIFYLLCAVAGAFAHGLAVPQSDVPLIGASGAVAGIVAAYLMLHPKVKIWILVMMRIPIRLPAWIVLGFWIGMQAVMFLAMPDDQVSWAAHLGGIVAGLVLVVFFKRRGVPLFDRAIVTPDAVQMDAPEPVRLPETVPEFKRAEPQRSSVAPKPSPWGRAGAKGRDTKRD